MRVILELNETVVIHFDGTDSAIAVSFTEYDGIKVETNAPDTTGRDGVIYHEPFHNEDEFDALAEEH